MVKLEKLNVPLAKHLILASTELILASAGVAKG